MKNCKKITAAVLAAILALSIFICPAFAGGAVIDASSATVTTTPESQSPEDLTYIPPTIPGTETETETQVPVTGMDPDVKENISFFQKLLERINELFNIFLEYIQKLGDILAAK